MAGTATMTDATDAVSSGLKYIDSIQVTPNVHTGGAITGNALINTDASAAGDFKITSATSGSVYFVQVVGN